MTKDEALRLAVAALKHGGCPPDCKDGMTDSGGVHPWGEAALIPCPNCKTIAACEKALAQPEPCVHAISGKTNDELWLEIGCLRSELADLKAQPEPEPVADVRLYEYSGVVKNGVFFEAVLREGATVSDGDKLYTSPPKREPEPEPVAWMDKFGNIFPLGAQRGPKYLNEPMKPLYLSPPKRKPLTDEEALRAISPETWMHIEGTQREIRLRDVRRIEAAHGIKEKNT